MRERIEDAEKRASDARRIADSAEQRANDAQYAANAAEQRAVMAQSDADAAKQRQVYLEKELQNADAAFQEERRTREQEVAEAQATIGALRHELQTTNFKVEAHGNAVQGIAGISQDLKTAQQ